MTKFSHIIIAPVLCFLIAGCSAPLNFVKSELKAWDHMTRAVELEKSEDYANAAQEYAFVAEHHPLASNYQTAVRKAALLNIHPSNPRMDFNAAHKWLQVYLTLPVPPEEKESVRSNIVLLEHVSRLETKLDKMFKEKDKINAEKDLVLSVAQKQSSKIKTSTQQIEKLEDMLTQAQRQLEEIKKVDLQMHSRKVNGDSNKPSKTAYLTHDLFPEAYSDDASPSFSLNTQIKKDSPTELATARKKTQTHENDEVNLLNSDKDNPRQLNSSTYPYTIQISSFFKKEDSIRAATESRLRGDITFTSPAHIQGKGYWYRVYTGPYRTLREAKKTVLEMKKQKYPQAFVSKMPFAIQIKADPQDEDPNKLKTGLQSRGFLAYQIPDNPDTNKAAILIGAFRTEKEAAKQASKLQGQGFKPKVIRR